MASVRIPASGHAGRGMSGLAAPSGRPAKCGRMRIAESQRLPFHSVKHRLPPRPQDTVIRRPCGGYAASVI